MSPLQYQKWLRLNEARRLLLVESADASEAAFRVGYESASQFNREYRRLFGLPPGQDKSGFFSDRCVISGKMTGSGKHQSGQANVFTDRPVRITGLTTSFLSE